MARETKKTANGRWKLWGWLALAGALFAATAMGAMRVRAFAVANSHFKLPHARDSLAVQGLKYTSRYKVQRVFALDFGYSIFSVPLAERRRRLLAIDWVEDASVSRIWPDRLVVRLRERQPVAFVFFRSGVLLIDSGGVLLEPPAQAAFTFPVLAGVREDEPEEARRERVRALLAVEQDLGPSAKDLSEVNASDPENIRVVAQVERRTLELVLGGENFGRRYRNFINHYPEIRRRSPEVKTFDLRLEDRITAKE
jgi:cell division protein FtsQ